LRWAHRFPDLDRTTGQRFAPVLAAWNADAGLDHGTFNDRYLGFADGIHAVHDLRQAAALSAQATTFNEMADAATPFAAAVRTIGSRHPSWPPVMKRLEERAMDLSKADDAGPAQGSGSDPAPLHRERTEAVSKTALAQAGMRMGGLGCSLFQRRRGRLENALSCDVDPGGLLPAGSCRCECLGESPSP
jgi:hypothetical protein